MQIIGKTVWIAGAARSGVAAAKILQKNGARVFVSDAKQMDPQRKQTLLSEGIGFEENGHDPERMVAEADLLVTSPAIPLDSGLPFLALSSGIPVVSEVEVAHWFRPPGQKWIGITGTNGKSTSTHYLAQLLGESQTSVVACGNIGLPVCEVVESTKVLVIELSSYQLETTQTAKFDSSVFLNLQEDHLLRYGNMDQYLRAKWRLVQMTSGNGIALVDLEVARQSLRLGFGTNGCKVHTFSPQNLDSQNKPFSVPLDLTVSIYGKLKDLSSSLLNCAAHHSINFSQDAGVQVKTLRQGQSKDTEEWLVRSPVLPGYHNALNLLACSLIANETGMASKELCLSQWESATSTYKHLPHRLELCGTTPRQVSIYNDSKATNLESLTVALKSFPNNVLLLVGGEPKGESFESLAKFTEQPIKKCFAFGRAGEQILNDLASTSLAKETSRHSRMLDAAEACLLEAKSGDTILLSPGCASFDEFQNFEHRGDTFREWAAAKCK